jgi:TDG/mug DNA glycosylase family protein
MPSRRLGDLVRSDLRLLLVAINPPPASVVAGQHFKSARNPFWRLLHEAGLTRTLLSPAEGKRLLAEGIGITSLVGRPTRTAAELGRAELRAGAVALRETVERLRPRVVALLGLTLYPFVFPGGDEPGPGLKIATLVRASVFVLPNPSGRNRAYPGFVAKLEWYRALAEHLTAIETAQSPSTKVARRAP